MSAGLWREKRKIGKRRFERALHSAVMVEPKLWLRRIKFSSSTGQGKSGVVLRCLVWYSSGTALLQLWYSEAMQQQMGLQGLVRIPRYPCVAC